MVSGSRIIISIPDIWKVIIYLLLAKKISEKAIKCLDQNWRAVLELADELYESLEICGERVGEIVAECAKLPPLPQSDLPSMKWLAEDNRRRGMNLKYEDVFGSST